MFNNFNPYLYQQMYQQQTPQAPQQQPEQNGDGKIWVQGEEAAKAYLVTPGGFVRLWDSQNNVFYEKQTDQAGRPYMNTFRYEQITAEEKQVPDEYLDKIKALEDRVKALESRRTGRQVKDDE